MINSEGMAQALAPALPETDLHTGQYLKKTLFHDSPHDILNIICIYPRHCLIFLKLFFSQDFRRIPSLFRVFTLCTKFGGVLGFEPKMLQPQPGVLPMSYTHPY